MMYRERALYRKKVCLPGSMAYLILLLFLFIGLCSDSGYDRYEHRVRKV
jgi:hypothetical protein